MKGVHPMRYVYRFLDPRVQHGVEREIEFYGPNDEILALRKAEERFGKGGKIEKISHGGPIVARHPDERVDK